MKHFGAVVLAIDMTNSALLPCQVMLLRHLLLNSLVCLHCLLIRLLRTGSSAHALHCAHSFICSYTCYGGCELNTLISFSFNPLCSGRSESRQASDKVQSCLNWNNILHLNTIGQESPKCRRIPDVPWWKIHLSWSPQGSRFICAKRPIRF